jgi:chemotaxis protein MotB
MSDDTQQPIVIRHINKGGHGGAHGGAWKIAYADFVTAMMAFFLLLWLLGSTADGDLKGIADFFQSPLKIAQSGGSGAGDSSSIIPGGGEDLSRAVGQVKRGDVEQQRRMINLEAARARDAVPVDVDGQDSRERARLVSMKGRIEALIEANPNLRAFRDQILIDITPEGLRVQIVDEQNRPMFDLSSAELRPHTRELLRAIGRALNDLPNRLSLSGHTDAKPFPGGDRGFSNWELSANRANASRREMIAGGLDPAKVLRVVGLSDTIPFNAEDPFDPSNRRITVIVMNKRTEDAVLGRTPDSSEVITPAPAPESVLDSIQQAL